MTDDPNDVADREGRLTNTLLWGLALGIVVGVALSVANVFLAFAAGSTLATINWPVLVPFSLLYYVFPCAGVGIAMALFINLVKLLISYHHFKR